MKFNTEAQLLVEALSVISKLAAPDSGNIVFQVGKKFRVFSSSQVNSVQVTLPIKTEGQAEFGISLDSLRQAIKGRSELQCVFKNTMLGIKSGRYSAELATVDAIKEESQETKFKSEIDLSADDMQSLKQMVNSVALKPNSLLASFMPCGVRMHKKGTFVSCFDTTHMAFTSTADLKGDAEFILPLDIVLLVTGVFTSGAKIRISDASVEVSNKLVTAVLAIPSLDSDLPSLEDVVNQSKAVKSATGTDLSLPKDDLITFLDNSRSIASRERSEVRFSSQDSKIELSVMTTSGQVKTSFKHKGKTKFVIDFEYFDEMVRKCPDTVELQLVGDAYLKAKTKSCYLVTGLNQDG